MTKVFRCEACSAPVHSDEFVYLSKNARYQEGDVFIFHTHCEDPQGAKVTEVIEVCGNLRLVRVEA